MNQINERRYSLQRVAWIALAPAVVAVGAWIYGYPDVTWGALAATPVGMFNYLLIYTAMQRSVKQPKVAQAQLLRRSLFRMVVSMATLWIALQFSVEAMLGALVGVVSEMMTYMGDAARAIQPNKRGGT